MQNVDYNQIHLDLTDDERNFVKNKIKEASGLKPNDIEDIIQTSVKENKIPKIIHFSFFNWENMPDIYLYFLKTWFDKLKDWTFINWNNNNFDVNSNAWTKRWYGIRNYAYVSDFIRVWAVYNFGGFYFDCDVICYKSLSDLLDIDYIFSEECWWKYNYNTVSFECGVFGAKKNNKFLKIIQEDYSNDISDKISPIKFIELLKNKEINIIVDNSINDIRENEKLVENSNNIYFLQTKYFSNTTIPHTHWAKVKFERDPEQYTSHEFTNSWCDPKTMNVFKQYFKNL